MVFENSCLLVNDGISHLEHLRALREGDIGAILKVLDIWTVGFHASSATDQYAQELLSLALGLKYQWSTRLKNMLTDILDCQPIWSTEKMAGGRCRAGKP